MDDSSNSLDSNEKKPRIVEVRRPTQLPPQSTASTTPTGTFAQPTSRPDLQQPPTPQNPSNQSAPANRENPLARAMHEEAMRDLRSSSQQPAPRVIDSSMPTLPLPASTSQAAQRTAAPSQSQPTAQQPLHQEELMRKIEVDRITRKTGLGSRISSMFGGLFKGKKKERDLGLLDK